MMEESWCETWARARAIDDVDINFRGIFFLGVSSSCTTYQTLFWGEGGLSDAPPS